MLSPGRAAVLAAARASGIVLPFQMSSGSGDVDDDHDDGDNDGGGNGAGAGVDARPGSAPPPQSQPSPLSHVHDSVLEAVLARLDARSKCSAAATCRRIAELLAQPRHWRVLALDSAAPLPPPPSASSADPQAPSTTATPSCASSCSPDHNHHNTDGFTLPLRPPPPPGPDAAARRGLAVARLLARGAGQVEAVRLAGARAARDGERRARFDAGLRRGAALPHTRGLRALALASLLGPSCQSLALDERASPLGGMTDDLARALAAHCPSLSSLEVAFGRYSPPAELFTDEGVAALALGCGGGRRPSGRALQQQQQQQQQPQPGRCPLARLALVNCDRLTDRALYAAAAGWGATLRELEVGGYNEHVSDTGLLVLLEATAQCGIGNSGNVGLRVARLGARLPKVTDATGRALARACAATLEEAALSSAMTGATLEALAAAEGGCPRLRRVDASACAPGSIKPEALARLAVACPRLESVRLPAGLSLVARAAAALVAAEAEAGGGGGDGVLPFSAFSPLLVEVVVVEEEAEDDEDEQSRGRRRRGSSNSALHNNNNSGSGSGDAADDEGGDNNGGTGVGRRRGSWSRPPLPPPSLHHPKLAAVRTSAPSGPSASSSKLRLGGGGASFARPAPEPRDLSCSPVFAFLTSEAGGWEGPQRLASWRQGFGGGGGGGGALVVPTPAPPPRRRVVELRVAAPGASAAVAYDLD